MTVILAVAVLSLGLNKANPEHFSLNARARTLTVQLMLFSVQRLAMN